MLEGLEHQPVLLHGDIFVPAEGCVAMRSMRVTTLVPKLRPTNSRWLSSLIVPASNCFVTAFSQCKVYHETLLPPNCP